MFLVSYLLDDDLKLSNAFNYLCAHMNGFPESLGQCFVGSYIICVFKLECACNHIFGLFGSTRTQPTPAPSLYLEPSKTKVHAIGSILKLVLTLYKLCTMVPENGIEVTWEIHDWFCTFSIGEASAGKYPKNVSNVKCSM